MMTPAVAAGFDVIRADQKHADQIAALVNSWAERKLMLRREAGEVVSRIGEFSIAVEYGAGRVVGCGALAVYAPGVSEIRSLCVDETFHGGGVGTAVTMALIARARRGATRTLIGGGPEACVLAVTKSPAFFTRLGFAVIDAEEYPAAFIGAGIRDQGRTLRGKHVVRMRLD